MTPGGKHSHHCHPSSTAKVLVNCMEQNPDSRYSQNNNYNDKLAQTVDGQGVMFWLLYL